jgi:hypothetical protein
MKKIFQKIGKGAKDFMAGAIIAPTKPIIGGVMGVFSGFKQESDTNLDSEIGGKGHVNWPRLAGLGVSVLLILLFAFGKINMEDLQKLLDYFN